MSLNGLDNPAIAEAYQNALSEAGGWLLLNYVSRDEVTLLDRGNGGVPDVRNCIDGYEEKSPLYGFLQYRRRKVVISYMPEGLSRLIQARTTVQFQSILDKFSPHDTVFSLSRSSELTESALSSACLLHAASGSITSSSSSLRRRRLKEITEDAEENTTGSRDAPEQSDTVQKRSSQMSDVTVVPPDMASEAPPMAADDAVSERHVPSEAPTNDETASTSRIQSERPSSQRDFQEDLSRPQYESRTSTQSARPYVGHTTRRKVKLGPRPSVDSSGRPRTSGSLSRDSDQRPVAALPAGIRSSSLRKPTADVPRPRSQGSALTPITNTRAPPIPPLLVPPPSMSLSRAPPSPGAKSMGAMSTISATGTSQEKERLMKALQQRKKQIEKRAEEKRNRQAAEEREKLSTIPDITEINKENVERSQGGQIEYVQDKPVDHITAKSEKGKEPLSEVPPFTAPESVEPNQEARPTPSDVSKPDSSVGVISDSEGDQSSNTSPPSTAATIFTDRKEPVEANPAAQAHPETTPVVPGASISGVPDENDTSDGPSSASADVPLGNKSQATPETESEIALPRQTATPPTSDQQEDHSPTEKPESAPFPDSRPSNSRPGSVAASSPVIVTSAPDPQHDLSTPETSNPVAEGPIEQKEKRKHNLEPIQVPTPDYSDDDNLSDDSFMEELKSATVEEAKPVSVGKSPLSPGFTNSESDHLSTGDSKNLRAVSNPGPVGRQSNLHAVSVGRSVSSPFNSEFSGSPVMMAKKINVSSGISKRIKALEKFSSRDPPSNFSQNTSSAPAYPAYDDLRRRASATMGGGTPGSHTASRRTSYVSEDPPHPNVQRSTSQLNANPSRRTSTVSVTAQIVREPNGDPSDATADSADSGALNLQPSPLTVENEPSEFPLSQTTTTDSATNQSATRSMSISSAGSGRLSLARIGRSESKMSTSSRSRASDVSSPEEKKESRTSRMLRRMSSITSNSRKSLLGTRSPTVQEEAAQPPEHDQKEPTETPQAVDIGEVNIQFPDTLLWKRRFMRIDDKGYLVFAPGNIDSSNRNLIKRYHLTEFTTPCLPDEDRQELPNSILLDFLSGSTLQAACESRQGQEAVLQTLLDAYNTHQQLSSR